MSRFALPFLAAAVLAGCTIDQRGTGPARLVNVPPGASFAQVADSLASRGLIRHPLPFRVYAQLVGDDRSVKAGTYRFRTGTGWNPMLEDLRLGRVVTERLVIPEGWDLQRIVPRIAAITRVPADSIMRLMTDSTSAGGLGLPGPTLEGYLYPATYTFPVGVTLDSVITRLVETYRRVWTPERRARADSIGMSERDVVTLASIIEKEARVQSEMPLISSVYHNRLERGIPLQADPTVQYALGVHRERLLYAAIDSVADNPYNTYRHAGLPPGPIASPSQLAIDAALNPAETDYYYFVAAPDGSHIFTRSLDDHNRARLQVRRAQAADSVAPRPQSADTGAAIPRPPPPRR
ncbi:MAG: endolytic transglycosylase MltG [Longimicrobiales bacterium]